MERERCSTAFTIMVCSRERGRAEVSSNEESLPMIHLSQHVDLVVEMMGYQVLQQLHPPA